MFSVKSHFKILGLVLFILGFGFIPFQNCAKKNLNDETIAEDPLKQTPLNIGDKGQVFGFIDLDPNQEYDPNSNEALSDFASYPSNYQSLVDKSDNSPLLNIPFEEAKCLSTCTSLNCVNLYRFDNLHIEGKQFCQTNLNVDPKTNRFWYQFQFDGVSSLSREILEVDVDIPVKNKVDKSAENFNRRNTLIVNERNSQADLSASVSRQLKRDTAAN